MDQPRTYLALGDSMSIDDYTEVKGGGAVSQFAKSLGSGWHLDDRTFDGCQMEGVPRDGTGDLITLTIGGNDLLWNKQQYLQEGMEGFAAEHLELLTVIRQRNPEAVLIVGDIYHPDAVLSDEEAAGLAAANEAIRRNGDSVGAMLAPIHDTFCGQEAEYLCLNIEPTLAGATAIARLFERAWAQAN